MGKARDAWIAMGRPGCICPTPGKLPNGKYDWKILPECKYHEAAAVDPSDHGVPWNCPTYWDGCNCTPDTSSVRQGAE